MLQVFETGARYQLMHALALVGVALAGTRSAGRALATAGCPSVILRKASREPAMGNKAAGWDPSTPELQTRFGYGSYKSTMDTLEKAVSGTLFIAADHFTAADLYVASLLNFGMMFNVIEKRPAFEAYIKPHVERPAWQKMMKQSGMAR